MKLPTFKRNWILHYIKPEFLYLPRESQEEHYNIFHFTYEEPSDLLKVEEFSCQVSFCIYSKTLKTFMKLETRDYGYRGVPIDYSGYESGTAVPVEKITTPPFSQSQPVDIEISLPKGNYIYMEESCQKGTLIKTLEFSTRSGNIELELPHESAHMFIYSDGSVFEQDGTPSRYSQLVRTPDSQKSAGYFALDSHYAAGPDLSIGNDPPSVYNLDQKFANKYYIYYPKISSNINLSLTFSYDSFREDVNTRNSTYSYTSYSYVDEGDSFNIDRGENNNWIEAGSFPVSEQGFSLEYQQLGRRYVPRYNNYWKYQRQTYYSLRASATSTGYSASTIMYINGVAVTYGSGRSRDNVCLGDYLYLNNFQRGPHELNMRQGVISIASLPTTGGEKIGENDAAREAGQERWPGGGPGSLAPSFNYEGTYENTVIVETVTYTEQHAPTGHYDEIDKEGNPVQVQQVVETPVMDYLHGVLRTKRIGLLIGTKTDITQYKVTYTYDKGYLHTWDGNIIRIGCNANILSTTVIEESSGNTDISEVELKEGDFALRGLPIDKIGRTASGAIYRYLQRDPYIQEEIQYTIAYRSWDSYARQPLGWDVEPVSKTWTDPSGQTREYDDTGYYDAEGSYIQYTDPSQATHYWEVMNKAQEFGTYFLFNTQLTSEITYVVP